MITARRPFTLFVIPLAALAAAASVFLGGVLEAARPLSDRVAIRRDTFGVPHILAEDEEALGP